MNTVTATERITAADVHEGDFIAPKQAGPFERVRAVERFRQDGGRWRRRFWFGRQAMGGTKPGQRAMHRAEDAQVWRQKKT